MNNNNSEEQLKEKLKNIKTQKLDTDEKNALWNNIIVGKARQSENKPLVINMITIYMKKFITILVIAIVVLGGSAVASANNAGPGDFLFGLDKALERLEIKFATEDKVPELKIKIAKERLEEIKEVSEENETFEFSDKEEDDISESLTDIEETLSSIEDDARIEEIRQALQDLLVLLGDDGKIEIRRNGNKIKIESKDGEIKIKVENDNKDKSSDDSDDDSDDDDDSEVNEERSEMDFDEQRLDQFMQRENSPDVRESDDEIFCRGEWRDAEDCQDDDSDDDSDDDDSDDDDEEDDD